MNILSQSQMLRGDDFKLNDKLIIKNRTIGEITDFGNDKYFNAISVFIQRPFDLCVSLDNADIDYQKLSDFQMCIYLMQNKESQENLKFLYGDLNFQTVIEDETNYIVLLDPINGVIIDEVKYTYISNYLKTINCIELKPIRIFPYESDRKEFIDHERGKLKRELEKQLRNKKPIEEDSMSKLITALAWGNSSGINIFNIWDLNTFQFYSGLKTVDKQKYVSYLMQGIYSGNVDSKNINKDDLNWMI